jgi:imidazolonepropionase
MAASGAAPADLLVDRIASLATVDADGAFRVVHDAALAAAAGRIVAVGPREDVLRDVQVADGAETVDARGLSAIPGLVDSHTHAVFAASRIDEFDRRAQGQGYEEIAAAGGGIRSSVRAVREASLAELAETTARRLRRMRALGTTTAEVKSGYGLDAASEAAMLTAAREAGLRAGVRVTGTCLALHATPPEAASDDAFVETAIREILPACAPLATAADCFLERGAFSAEQCRPYLQAARDLGLAMRMHGDQFSECGAIPLAVELGATSVDHLEATGPEGVALLARSGVAGVCLPLCALYLDLVMPPARALLDAGGRLVLATDFNPGSAPSESMLAVLNLACTQLALSCAEALTAATAAAADVLGLGADVGRLAPGYAADLVLLDDPDWRVCAYHLGEVPARVLATGGAASA